MISSGRETKLFPFRFKFVKEDKQPITPGTACRLQNLDSYGSKRTSLIEQALTCSWDLEFFFAIKES